MKFRRVQPSELVAVFELLVENGWGSRLGNLSNFRDLVAASQIAEVAVLDGRVVGFTRGITDGLSNGYLSMVVVAATHRGQGIGRKLVSHAMGVNPSITWVLRAGRDGASGFFAKLGFEPSTLAMERMRAQHGA